MHVSLAFQPERIEGVIVQCLDRVHTELEVSDVTEVQ